MSIDTFQLARPPLSLAKPMLVDATVYESPGWWLNRLSLKLTGRLKRLNQLNEYYVGNPPLPEGSENMRAAYIAFQKKSRTNYAELIVEALRERCIITGFRTAAAGDENGDLEAWRMWKNVGMQVEMADVLESAFAMGDGYVIVGKNDAGDLVVTGEDPRQVVTEHDPREQRKVIAAVKIYQDTVAFKAYCYLYLPGRVYVASRDIMTTNAFGAVPMITMAGGWRWDADKGGADGLPLGSGLEDVVPVVRFRNKRGIGEFEHHTDLLDRINQTILDRMVISTMQAFRQRAMMGDFPEYDDSGEKVNYDTVFRADPGGVWLLPENAQMWESGLADLNPLLMATQDDVKALAAVTRTPLHLFAPDRVTQTAEGASTAKEGTVFKAEDRIVRLSVGAAQVLSLMYRMKGDASRGKLEDIEVLWAPPERFSLAERSSAAVQAQSAGVPWATRMGLIMQFSPDQVSRMQTERLDDAILAPQLALLAGGPQAQQAQQPQPNPGQTPVTSGRQQAPNPPQNGPGGRQQPPGTGPSRTPQVGA